MTLLMHQMLTVDQAFNINEQAWQESDRDSNTTRACIKHTLDLLTQPNSHGNSLYRDRLLSHS